MVALDYKTKLNNLFNEPLYLVEVRLGSSPNIRKVSIQDLIQFVEKEAPDYKDSFMILVNGEEPKDREASNMAKWAMTEGVNIIEVPSLGEPGQWEYNPNAEESGYDPSNIRLIDKFSSLIKKSGFLVGMHTKQYAYTGGNWWEYKLDKSIATLHEPGQLVWAEISDNPPTENDLRKFAIAIAIAQKLRLLPKIDTSKWKIARLRDL